MKWYIEISGTSLSEEAKRICKINQIFSLDQLVAIYIVDRDFSQLTDLSEEIREEIMLFVGKLMSFFTTTIKELSSIENTPSSEEICKTDVNTKKQLVENFTADELLEKEIINVRLYNICMDNELKDFTAIFHEYSRRGTFKHLRNSGDANDSLLQEIFTKYEIRGVAKKNSISYEIPDDQNDSSNSFKKYISQQEFGSYSSCLSAIEPFFEFEENKLFLFLVDFYMNVNKKRGIGRNKSAQIKHHINEYFKQHAALDPKQKRFLSFLEAYDDSNFAKDTFELWSCYNESIQSLLFYLLNSYLRFNTKDHIYMNRFLCFFEDSQSNSYEELEQLFDNELDETVPIGTVKGQINRTRGRIKDFFNEVLSLFGPVYLIENINTENGNEYLLFKNESLEDLNIGLSKKLSKEFYRYLLTALYENHYRDICEGQNIKSYLSDNTLCFISSKYHPDFVLSIRKFEELYKKRRNTDLSVSPEEFLDTHSEALSELFTKYVYIEYDDVEIKEDKIILLPNNEGRKTTKDLLIEIFRESDEPIEYNNLISLFDQKFPGIRTSYRSLRDVLLYAPEFSPLGGNTNKYILSEWDEKYVSGPLKELTIAHFSKIQDSDHFYNVYRKIHSQRAEVSLKGIMQVLGSNSFFISERGGVYYFVDYPPTLPNNHQNNLRIINGAIDKIENEKLLIHRKQTIEILLEKFPDYSKTQIEYAIDLKLGIAEI